MKQAQAQHTCSKNLQTLAQAFKKKSGHAMLPFCSLYLKLISMLVLMAPFGLLVSFPSRRRMTFGPYGAYSAEGRACPMGQG